MKPITTFLSYAKSHPFWLLGVTSFTVLIGSLCFFSFYQLLWGNADEALKYGFFAGLVGFTATAIGSFPAFFIKTLPQKVEDSLLGASAGMMLAASVFSLLLPAIEASNYLYPTSKFMTLAVVCFGMVLGVLLLFAIDAMTPHIHRQIGHHGPQVASFSGTWLYAFTIVIHNFPEGMALGISFVQPELEIGVPLTIAIALQDIPEGLVVVLALRALGLSNAKAVLFGMVSGLMEPIGALFGVFVSSGFPQAYPIGLALSASAMIFVVSHEVIPETHRNGHQTIATLGLMTGFTVMMILDYVF